MIVQGPGICEGGPVLDLHSNLDLREIKRNLQEEEDGAGKRGMRELLEEEEGARKRGMRELLEEEEGARKRGMRELLEPATNSISLQHGMVR